MVVEAGVEISRDGVKFHGGIDAHFKRTDLPLISARSLLEDKDHLVEVSSVWPSMGSVVGGTLLEVRGKHFAVTGALTCRLMGLVSGAEAVSSTLLRCVTPQVKQTGSVMVEVSGNGVEYAGGHVEFEYLEAWKVVGIYPSLGPESGGIPLTMVGTGFDQRMSFSCRFGFFWVWISRF